MLEIDSAGDITGVRCGRATCRIFSGLRYSGMNRYTYRAEWLPGSGNYVARCLELPTISYEAPTMLEAMAAAERAVDREIAYRQEAESTLPAPITEHSFSGTFLVRTSPTLHARLAVEAADQNVSMNHWIALKLADRPPSSLLGW